MIGTIKALFSSEKTISKAVNGVYNGIDKAFYTDEEKADTALKKAELYRKMLKAYEPFKLAQRLLALIYSIPYVSIVVYGVVVNNMAIINSVNEALGLQCAIIVGFYFGGGAAEGLIRAQVSNLESKGTQTDKI